LHIEFKKKLNDDIQFTITNVIDEFKMTMKSTIRELFDEEVFTDFILIIEMR